MMSTYHVRVRGRVQGPYSEEQLRILIQRGQVSRIHEASLDQVSWSKISEYPELFQNNSFGENSTPNDYSNTTPQASVNNVPDESQEKNSPTSEGWYYYLLGQKKGPIALGELEQMMRQRQCGPTTLIWTHGMSDWMPASSVVQFQHLWPYSAGATQEQTESFQSDLFPASNSILQSVSRNLSESRIWIGIILIQGYAGLAFVLIQFALIFTELLRSKGPAFKVTTIFVLSLIPIILILVLLTRYWNSVGSQKIVNNESELVTATKNLKQYWIALGIIALIGLICMLVLTILFFAGVLDAHINQTFRDI